MKSGPIEKRQWYQYANTLVQIVDEVTNKYGGDKRRIYLTGLSRGGHGSWGVLKAYPDRFAAVLPIAGELSCRRDCDKIADTPMWIIHNRGDRNVAYKYSFEAAKFLEDSVGKAFLRLDSLRLDQPQIRSQHIFSSLEKEGHDAWSAAYSTPSVYLWLLDKRL